MEPTRCLEVARTIVAPKTHNQRVLVSRKVRSLSKGRGDRERDVLVHAARSPVGANWRPGEQRASGHYSAPRVRPRTTTTERSE